MSNNWGAKPRDLKNELSFRTFSVMNEIDGSGGAEGLVLISSRLLFSYSLFSSVLSSWESLCYLVLNRVTEECSCHLICDGFQHCVDFVVHHRFAACVHQIVLTRLKFKPLDCPSLHRLHRSKMSFHQALNLFLELDEVTIRCTWDILRQRDCLDRLSEIPCLHRQIVNGSSCDGCDKVIKNVVGGQGDGGQISYCRAVVEESGCGPLRLYMVVLLGLWCQGGEIEYVRRPSQWKELSKETSSKILPCGDRSCWKTFKLIASLIVKEIEINAGAFSSFHRQCQIQRISLTGFPAQSVGSSNTDVLDLPCLLVLIIGTSQSRQHVDMSLIHIESRKSPTKSLFDAGSSRISIFTVNTLSITRCSGTITRDNA
ncbi:hypothetical protein Tco_0683650 [Tanacetum coccineum]